MSEKIFSLLCGTIFGIGLVISGMTNPEKVIGFLSITHNWDASLIFVMGGAILVFSPAFYFLKEKEKSLLGIDISLSKNSFQIDKKLVLGTGFFGIGWGLVGICPGPAISSLVFFQPVSIIFLVSLLKSLILLIDYCFNKLNLNELFCSIKKENIYSLKLFKSTGFKETGELKGLKYFKLESMAIKHSNL